jgi:putative FmdB family regulatory protein
MGLVAMSELALVAGAAINKVTIAMLNTRMIFIVRPFSATLIRIYLPTSLDLLSTPSGNKRERNSQMPTYQYACSDCGHQFEVFQTFSEASLTSCPECKGTIRKVYSAVGVVFKGSGFYKTDSAKSTNTETPAATTPAATPAATPAPAPKAD